MLLTMPVVGFVKVEYDDSHFGRLRKISSLVLRTSSKRSKFTLMCMGVSLRCGIFEECFQKYFYVTLVGIPCNKLKRHGKT